MYELKNGELDKMLENCLLNGAIWKSALMEKREEKALTIAPKTK